MEQVFNESFELLLEACRADKPHLATYYKLLRDLLERICREEMTDQSLQMTDLSARISFVSNKIGLSVVEQNRLHTFRLTSNAILNRRSEPTHEQLLRDVKTLAFFVRKLSGQDIPTDLYRLLPRTDATYLVAPTTGEPKRRMRVCFQYADEQYLYVLPLEEVSDVLLKVRYNVPQVNDEFNATCEALWLHAQLNLLDVTIDEHGILTPAFIVLEPDYLIDISTLAECFRDYGHHPMNYIFARFQPVSNARPLLLGNIANLFLDEWIHTQGEVDYLACMQKAFRSYPIELAACAELRDPAQEREFFADCRKHFDHLRKVVTETFQAPGYELDKNDAVLEPSYICEALGLQGRLDYMQRDMTAFIEMKSGKADEYATRGKVQPKENNRVQMMLYQAVLQYAMGQDHRKVKPYLLYTRYPLLYPARPSWAMVRRVIDLRNRIVANEHHVQLHNSVAFTAEQLSEIRVDTLNERKLKGRFWEQYLRPTIDSFGENLRQCSPLEQAYFYTLYNFITKELYTSKSGDSSYVGRTGAAGLWLSTLAEKSESGEILYDLTIQENRASDVHKPSLTLSLSHVDEMLPNFRSGDAIVLYQRNGVADNVTNKMVFKGNVEWLTSTQIRVRLRATQQNEKVLPIQSFYAIEPDTMDTSFRQMYQGLSHFLLANQDRRDLLLGQRLPSFDTSFDTQIASASTDFERVVLKAQAANDYFLLVGPPGTGKTSWALKQMVEAFHAQPDAQILLLSYTNRAVDEICKALSSIAPNIDFIRVGSELSCDEAYRSHLMESVLEHCVKRTEVQARISSCRVFVGTVAAISGKPELFQLKTFDVAIVDEATQILEPQLLGILSMRSATGANAVGKFILIGDHKQLPAVVLLSQEQAEVQDDLLRNMGLINLKDSLFERLYRSARKQQVDLDCSLLLNRSHDMLCKQGRMHPEVASFANQFFYEGRLIPVGLPHQLEDSVNTQRLSFYSSVSEPLGLSPKTNQSEAYLAAQLALQIHQQYGQTFNAAATLGIITPYRSQIALIRKAISQLGIPELNQILVDTVERFQGSERDVIIYSCCVNYPYQLRLLSNLTIEGNILIDRKLNVALTRARKQMVLIGDRKLLSENELYFNLIKTALKVNRKSGLF